VGLLKNFIYAGSLAILIFATGCASVPKIESAGDLTRKDLQPQGIAIGGITAMGGGESVYARDFADRVRQRFVTARPWLQVAPLDETKKRFAPGEYEKGLKRLNEKLEWSPEDMAMFNSLTNNFRYVLVIDIRAAKEGRGIRHTPDIGTIMEAMFFPVLPPDGDARTKYGNIQSQLLFSIFDLKTRTTVWIALAEAKLQRREPPLASGEGTMDESQIALTATPPNILEALEAVLPKVAARLPK
jgi:hypothetical protein